MASEYESRIGVVTLERKWQTTQAQSVTLALHTWDMPQQNALLSSAAAFQQFEMSPSRPQTDDDNLCQNQVTKSSSLPHQLNTLRLSEKRGLNVLQIYFATPPQSNQCQSIAILHLSLQFLNEIQSSCTWHWNLVAKFYVILSLTCSGPTLAPTFYHQICPQMSVGWLRGSWRRISKGVTISNFLK